MTAGLPKAAAPLRSVRWQAQGAALSEQGLHQMEQARATAQQLHGVLNAAAAYEDLIKDIAISANLTREKEVDLAKSVRQAAVSMNVDHQKVAGMMQSLVDGGMSADRAKTLLPVLAKTAHATRRDTTVISGLATTFDTLGVKKMELAFNQVAKASKLGGVSMDEMAASLPKLGGYLGDLGVKGEQAVVNLGARLQVSARTAGNGKEAADNLEHFLSKLSGADSVRAFSKRGVDLLGKLRGASVAGQDPVATGIDLFMNQLQRNSSKAGDQLNKLALEMGQITDPVQRQQLLQRHQALFAQLGKETGLKDLFGDMQAVSYLLAELSSKNQLPGMINDISSGKDADGRLVIDAMGQRRGEGMTDQLNAFKVTTHDLKIALGNALIPAMQALLPIVTQLVRGLTGFIDAHPKLAATIGTLVVGATALSFAGGAIKVVRGTALGLAGRMSASDDEAPPSRMGRRAARGRRIKFGGPLPKLGAPTVKPGGIIGKGLRGMLSGVGRLAGVAARGLRLLGSAGRVAFGLLSVGARGFGMALTANPIGMVIRLVFKLAEVIWRNWRPISRFAGTLFNGLMAGIRRVKNFLDPFLKIGGQIIDGLVGGIRQGWTKVVETISKLGSAIRDKFKSLLGISSPSRVFMGFGANIGEGAQQGIQSKLGAVRQASGQMAGVAKASAVLAGSTPAPTGHRASAAGAGMVLHFSPTVHVAGASGARGAVEQAMRLSMQELEQLLRRLQGEQQRRAF